MSAIGAEPTDDPCVRCGPGPASTITYALDGALTLPFSGRTARRVAVVVGRLVIGPWRKLDRFLVTRQATVGSSCTMIFIGRRVERSTTATDVVAQAKALGVAPVLGPAPRA